MLQECENDKLRGGEAWEAEEEEEEEGEPEINMFVSQIKNTIFFLLAFAIRPSRLSVCVPLLGVVRYKKKIVPTGNCSQQALRIILSNGGHDFWKETFLE